MNSEDIKELSKLGLSSDQIIAVIPFLEKILSRDVTLLSRRQSRDRERQRKFRAKTKQSIENEQNPSRDGHVMSQNTVDTYLLKDSIKKESKATGKRFDVVTLPESWREFCLTNRPDLNPDELFAEFGDYWRGVPGAKGCKLDWDATWRNRVREKFKRATQVSDYKIPEMKESREQYIARIKKSTDIKAVMG